MSIDKCGCEDHEFAGLLVDAALARIDELAHNQRGVVDRYMARLSADYAGLGEVSAIELAVRMGVWMEKEERAKRKRYNRRRLGPFSGMEEQVPT